MTEAVKKYYLMHKNIKVAALDLDIVTGGIVSIGEIYAEGHIPIGIMVKKHQIDRKDLNHWWSGRAIPASRAGLKSALQRLEVPDTQLLLEKCLGLSLSDQYWICPADSDLLWEQVNFFDNPFSEDVGNILMGAVTDSDNISLMSPDNTSDGWLKKSGRFGMENAVL